MLPRAPWDLPTIALVMVLVAVGASPAWAQICANSGGPNPPAMPTRKTPPAMPQSVRPPSLPGGDNTSLSSGPVAYWKLDDASGTLVADSVGSNTGTWNGVL